MRWTNPYAMSNAAGARPVSSRDPIEAMSSPTSGATKSSVTLELTESRWMKDLRAPLDIRTRLRLTRIRLSIENFGTGGRSRSCATFQLRRDDLMIGA